MRCKLKFELSVSRFFSIRFDHMDKKGSIDKKSPYFIDGPKMLTPSLNNISGPLDRNDIASLKRSPIVEFTC